MKNQILKSRKTLKIINIFLRKVLPFKFHSYLYLKILTYFNREKIQKIQNRIKIPLINIQTLKKYKKTDKVFILGSGSSINTISSQEWDEILENDTIGFNFWLYHDIVPKFYCYEENLDKSRNDIFYQLLNLKRKDYKNVIFIIKDLEYKGVTDQLIPKELKKNFRLSYELTIPYDKTQQISNFFRRYKDEKVLMKKNGTLSYLVILLYYLGYKEIILCGIDLDDNDYFYFDKKYKIFPQLKKFNNIKQEHLTEQGKIKMSEVLEIISKEMPEVSIKIYSSIGKLKNKFEIYKK